MGIILSRVRKKKPTIETLEKLDNDIKEIEENRLNAQRKYKKITKLLLIYSVGLYILCGLIFYFQYTSTLQGKLLYLLPLALSPLLLYIVKRFISWYFVRLLNKNEKRLNEMKKEKKRILDEVMDTETYKVAKEILEKFSNEPVIKPNYKMELANPRKIDEQLRRRMISPVASAPMSQTRFPLPNNRPLNKSPLHQPMTSSPMMHRPMPVFPAPSTPVMQLPAPILPLQRSYVDRVVEYLIGDGPNNRYALICSKCHSHNGMALKEEFEYIGFKCCYCFFYNPARKIRPEAPKLEAPSRITQESDSDSDKTSGENSDADQKTALVGESVNKIEDLNLASEENNSTDSKADKDAEIEPIDEAPQTKTETENLSEETEVQKLSEDEEEEVSSIQPEMNANGDNSVVES